MRLAKQISAFFTAAVKNKKLRTAVLCVAFALVFFGCSGFVVSQAADIKRLKNQQAAYDEQLAEQEAENDRLEEILDSEDRDAYIEQKAREKGYVKSGEIVFYDVSGSGN